MKKFLFIATFLCSWLSFAPTYADNVAKIGSDEYATLAEAIVAVPTDGTATTITMIADETVSVSGYALTIAAGQNVVLDLSGYQVVGTCETSGTSALIRNLGTLTIQDSSDEGTGKLIAGADPTWTWDGTEDYSGSYASNLIRNEGDLTINSGLLLNVSTGSAAYAIDNYSAGNITINGGKVDAAKASAIRMFYVNGGSVTVNGGVVGHYNSDDDRAYMGIQVMYGANVDVTVSGGTIAGDYALYANNSGGSIDISGGTFNGYVAFGSTGPSDISITGGVFNSWVGTWGDQTGFISGGTYYEELDDEEYLAEGYSLVNINGTYTVFEGNPVALIGDTAYETLAAAVAAATDGATIQVIKAGEYAIPAITKNLTIEAIVNDVVVNHEANSAITTIASGKTATFKNITFDLGTLALPTAHGFGTTNGSNGSLVMDGCIINGALNLFGESTFTSCTFNAEGIYNIWAVNDNATFTGCTFTNTNRAVNVYDQKKSSTTKNVSFSNCTFAGSAKKKAAVNIHHNPDPVGAAAQYAVSIDDCTTTGTWASTVEETGEPDGSTICYSPLWMISDIVNWNDGDIAVTVDGVAQDVSKFSPVAQIGDTKYTSLAAAVAAAVDGDVITLIADDTSLSDGSEITINKTLTITGELDDDTNGEPLYTIYGKSTVTGHNDIFITGSGTVTISNVKIKNFGNDASTDPGHAPIYVSSNYTGTVNLTNVYVSDFNRGGMFLYGGTFNVDGCYIDCANSTSGAFTKGIEIKNTASGIIQNTDIYNMERSSTTYSSAGIEIMGNGSIVVDRCTIVSDNDEHSSVKATYGIVASPVGDYDPAGGSLQVTECLFNCSNGCLSIDADNYSVVLDDCSFENYIVTWNETSSITINSGSYAEDVYADAGTIIIHGGEFTNFAPYTETGSIVIDGGIFDADPTDYCAEGYTTVYNSETELYTVQELPDVATIGETAYKSLADAIAAVPADGTATTITMIANETVASGITIASGKNIVLELAGFTISETLSQTGTSALITNNGTLTIQDNTDTSKDGTGTGKITYNNGNPDQQSVPGYASNTIINQGNLTIESGYIENTTSGGYAAYTVDNLTNGGLYTPVFTMNGGKLYNSYTDAVRMFLNSTTNLNKVVIAGGVLDSDKASGRVVVMQMPSAALGKGELDITGGTISGKVNAWSAANAGGVEDQFSDQQYNNVSINISGGSIEEIDFSSMANLELRANSVQVTGGTFAADPSAYVTGGYAAVQDSETGLYTVEEVKVAQIGDVTYPSLAAAIAAVPTNGTATTITMIDNEIVAAGTTMTIATGKNIVLDLNGKTISGSSGITSSFYFITNNGTLEITDSSQEGEGKITYQSTSVESSYSKEFVTLYNVNGTLTLTKGTVENTSGGGLAYAINNSSNAWGSDVISTFNMTGGRVSAPHGDAALRVYQNCAANAVQSKNYVNISGGTIDATGIFVDETLYNNNIPANYSGDNIDTKINISGGTVVGLIDMKIRHPFNTLLNITGGDFADSRFRVRKADGYVTVCGEPTAPMVTISGGTFHFSNAHTPFGLNGGTGSGTTWTSYEKAYAISDGVFDQPVPAEFCAESYVPAENTDATTSQAYPYTVELPMSEQDIVLTDGQPYTFTQDTQVKSVTYKRTLSDGNVNKYLSWYVPFNYTITAEDAENLTFFKISMIANSPDPKLDSDPNKIWIFLTEMSVGETLKANKPYIFKSNTDGEFTFTTETTEGVTLFAPEKGPRMKTETTLCEFAFYGTYAPKSLQGTYIYYMGSKGALSRAIAAPQTIGSYRWYIEATPKEEDYAPVFVFTEDLDDDATGISQKDNVVAEESYYNLNGMRINKPANGAYIIKYSDGSVKKVAVK